MENYLEDHHTESENKSFLFGFRQSGVDHDVFILSRFNQNEYTDEYRAIYRLDLKFITDELGWNDDELKMTLYRVK